MYPNYGVTYYNTGYGNNRNNRSKFEPKPQNDSPSNGASHSEHYGPPRFSTFQGQKKWSGWNSRNPRNNSDSSPRPRRVPELNSPTEQERKEVKPRPRQGAKPLQQQHHHHDQQAEEDDVKENKADEEVEVERKGNGAAEEKGNKVQHRPGAPNKSQHVRSITLPNRPYDKICVAWLNSSSRKQNNHQRNYGANPSNPQSNQKRQNGYRQWENSNSQKNNSRNNHHNQYNNHHYNNYQHHNNNYTHGGSDFDSACYSGRYFHDRPPAHGPDVNIPPPDRNPQIGSPQCVPSLMPLFPAHHLTAAVFNLQKFTSQMVVPRTPEPPRLCNGSGWDNLSKAIWVKFVENQQSEKTLIAKVNAWGSFYHSLQQIYQERLITAPDRSTPLNAVAGTFGLYLVGSTYTGFGLNGSDVDTCVTVNDPDDYLCNQGISFLYRIRDNIAGLKVVGGLDVDQNSVNLIFAKVPVLKFVDTNSKVLFDVNFHNTVGIRNTHLLFHYCLTEWRVRPLVILVKLWAKFHCINDAKEMTLSSYSLTLMVIHYLQFGVRPAVLPCLQKMSNRFNPDQPLNLLSALNFPFERQHVKPFDSDNLSTLGELLLGFFEYYSTFNFNRDGISVRLGNVVAVESCRTTKAPKNEPGHWKFISIEEPFELTNTARAVFDEDKFIYIVEVFRDSAKKLSRSKDLNSIFVRYRPPRPASNSASQPAKNAQPNPTGNPPIRK